VADGGVEDAHRGQWIQVHESIFSTLLGHHETQARTSRNGVRISGRNSSPRLYSIDLARVPSDYGAAETTFQTLIVRSKLAEASCWPLGEKAKP
jgi:hypothetical protein